MTQENKNSVLDSLATGQHANPKTNLETKLNKGVKTMIKENTKKATKKEKLLMQLIQSGKKGLIVFDTRDAYGDTSLRTDISKLHRNEGFDIPRKWVKAGMFNSNCKCYWLSDDDMPKAQKLVNHLRIKRGEQPLFTDV